MQYSTALILLLIPTFAVAQYGGGGSGDGSPSGAAASSTSTAAPSTFTSTSGIVTHTVAVGLNGGITYTPNTITANIGDAVEFLFYTQTHSVNQATFDMPCQPANGTGFASGAITTSSGLNAQVFTIKINDTNPIWFYCGFPGHCQAGMTGVINAPADGSQTLAAFNKAAAGSAKSSALSSPQGGTISAAATPSATAKPNTANNLGGWMSVLIVAMSIVSAGLLM